MALIECISGGVTAPMGNRSYAFQRDDYGRFVCEVHEPDHIKCFLAVEAHYREVPEVPEDPVVMIEKSDAADVTADDDPNTDTADDADGSQAGEDPATDAGPLPPATGEGGDSSDQGNGDDGGSGEGQPGDGGSGQPQPENAYTEEQLKAIAAQHKMKGLKIIGKRVGVTDTSINGLIGKILEKSAVPEEGDPALSSTE